jgi:translation initiation factor IF-3
MLNDSHLEHGTASEKKKKKKEKKKKKKKRKVCSAIAKVTLKRKDLTLKRKKINHCMNLICKLYMILIFHGNLLCH